MLEFSVPVADLRDYCAGSTESKQRFIDTVGTALRDVGFFALTNHGVDDLLIEEAYDKVRQFFLLPDDAKRQYQVGNGGQRGFTSFGTEHAKDHDAPDLKEFWHVGRELPTTSPLYEKYPQNVWPSEVPVFRDLMLNLFQGLDRCAMAILEACALFIDEPVTRFSAAAQNGNSILRLIHYPPVAEDRHPASIRAAAHEDINLITLLIDATSAGLELMRRDGSWMPVVTPKNCIIVDSGDMLQNMTNGFYRSTTHRVVNPNDSRDRRFSMPYFVHPRSEVSLRPLASCIEKTGGKVQFPEITAGQYLQQRLEEIGLA